MLTTYGVGMLLSVAHDLNNPFGLDVQDIKLNRLTAAIAYDLLVMCSASPITRDALIDRDHDTPTWLEDAVKTTNETPSYPTCVKCESKTSIMSGFGRVLRNPISPSVAIGLTLFILWCCFLVIGSHFLSEEVDSMPAFWWSLYIPFANDTLGYISLGVFLLLGLWLNEAYGRYWTGLQLWQTNLRPNLEHFAFHVSLTVKRGLWHQRDHERILSYIAAYPIALKQHLRGSRDLSELDGILSPKDLVTLAEAPVLPLRIMDVLSAYMMAIDAEHLTAPPAITWAFGASCLMLVNNIPTIESSYFGCQSLRKFPIAPAFTKHLQFFTIFWLALLPLPAVTVHGWVTFLYLIPIAYSILRLLDLGIEMSYPFDDTLDDIPLERFCAEFKQSVIETYRQTKNNARHFLRAPSYNREDFKPKPRPPDLKRHGAGEANHTPHETNPTVLGSLRKFQRSLPCIPIWALLLILLWNIAATFISWGLSKLWKDKSVMCRNFKWCSAIDLDPKVLSNIGFALFMILSFRVSDALGRYETGASEIYTLRVQLRNLAVAVVHGIKDGTLHEHAKERIVAHLVQVPLCLRNMLIERKRSSKDEDVKESLLSDEDLDLFLSSHNPLDHLLKTVEAYFISADMPGKKEPPKKTDKTLNFVLILSGIIRMSSLRVITSKILSMKRFPVVGSYVRHQRVFMVFWLASLPFAMTKQTGFFTILWATVVAYGVLGLENLAVRLVDPFGTDQTDLPVESLLNSSANAILEVVNNADWDCLRHTRESLPDEDPRIGSVLVGSTVYDNYTMPRIDPTEAKNVELGHMYFDPPKFEKVKPSIYAHVLKSSPKWTVIFATVWAVIACVISYLTRIERNGGESQSPWWKSFISINPSVTGYVSFGAFTSLGFFVQFAYGRYNRGGVVWGDNLRGLCHTLASLFLSHWPENELHPGDKRRIIGHIAAIPIALKAELRDSRDLRELRGLLSSSDVARIQYADSMSLHCFTVVLAYFFRVVCRQDTIESKKVKGGRVNVMILLESFGAEGTIQIANMLKGVPIASGFIRLLHILLVIWFFILPFVLAELTGWFTILWVPLIAYGVLGMYQVADELQYPFGTNLNDLDLDELATSIAADVISTYRLEPGGFRSLVKQTDIPKPMWSSTLEDAKATMKSLFRERARMSKMDKLKERVQLAFHALNLSVMPLIVLWSALIIVVAYFVRRKEIEGERSHCFPWFCSPIAIESTVKDYVGYALFLLLAFRLNDSHRRYVEALRIWKEDIIGEIRLFTARWFASFRNGTWHENDANRVAGYLSAFVICLMGRLRGKTYPDKLREVVAKEDVERILMAEEPAEYCLDVVRAYAFKGEAIWMGDKDSLGSGIELVRAMHHIRALSSALRSSTRLVTVPLPFGYVQHLRIFLCIWILLLPLGLVETSGWLSILWVPIISYGVMGMEHWAQRLSNPFTLKVSDVQLEKMCERVVAVITTSMHVFNRGNLPFIQPDRTPFPYPEEFEGQELPQMAREKNEPAMLEEITGLDSDKIQRSEV